MSETMGAMMGTNGVEGSRNSAADKKLCLPWPPSRPSPDR